MGSSSVKVALIGEDVSLSSALARAALHAERTGKAIDKAGEDTGRSASKWSAGKVAATALAGGLLAGATAAVAFGKKSEDAYVGAVKQANALARTTGLTVEDASKLRFAAEHSGVGFDLLSGSLVKASKNLTTNKAAQAELGFAIRDAHGQLLPMSELIPKIADRFAHMQNGPEKTALAMKIFGKTGADLLPFLNKGSEGIAKLGKSAEELGAVVGKKDVAAVAESVKAHREWGAAMDGLQVTVGRAVFPVISKFAQFLAEKGVPVIQAVARWAKDTLTPAMHTVGEAFQKVTAFVGPLVDKLTANKTAMSAIGSILKVVVPTILAVIAGMKAWAAIQAILNVVMDANPIGLIVIAIAALVAGIVWAYGHFKGFRDVVQTVFKAVAAAGKWLWESVLRPVFTAIGAVVMWVYNNVIKPMAKNIALEFKVIGAIANWLWSNVFKPVFAAIGAVIGWLYDHVVKPAVANIKREIAVAGAVFSWLYNNAIKPMVDNAIRAFNLVKSALSSAWNGLKDIASRAFQAVLGAVRGPINAIIGLVNQAIDGINSIHVSVPSWVPLAGGKTFGIHIPHIPMLAAGGILTRPTLMVGGEAGPEAVVPLSRASEFGLGAAQTVIHINLPPSGDPYANAKAVVQQLIALARSKGATLQIAGLT